MKLKSYIYLLVASAVVFFAACTPDKFELGAKDLTVDDLVEGIAFKVTVDQTTNTVELKSLVDNKYTVLWSHPQGRSQAKDISLKIPFAGTYEVTFGVETRGGMVYGEPHTFVINDLKPELLENPLWEILSGGVGKSKTWVLDINAEGQCKYFTGPLYFYGELCTWLEDHEAVHGTNTLEYPSDDCWDWKADWAGNGSWLLGGTGAMDYGSMTFDLIDGANVVVEDLAAGKTYRGTYLLDTNNHTMKLTDAPLLHDPGRDAIVTQWGTITILSMTQDYMQLGVIRDNDPSEGPCLLVYNFISKDYSDNWTPPVNTGGDNIEDLYEGNANDDMTTIVTTTMTWKLNTNAPYDWYWWSSASSSWESNGFASLSDYANTIWAPQPDAAAVKKFSLIMTKTSEQGGQYTLVDAYGETIEGKYTSEGSWIDFGQEVALFEATGTWTAAVKAQKMRIVKTEKKAGQIAEMWLGVPNKENAKGETTEYICAKLQPAVESSGEIPARSVDIDNSKILYGNLEGNGNFRIEIYNEYGSGTANNPPIDASEITFDEKMVVEFTIEGLGRLTEPADAFIMFGGSVWPSEGSENVPYTQVTGDGTYTVSIQGMSFTDLLVFCIDIKNVQDKTTVDISPGEDKRCPNVTTKIESIKLDGSESSGGGPVVPPSVRVDIDNSKIHYGDIEGNSNFRIEIFNAYGSGTADNPPIDASEITFNEKMVVEFTVAGLGTLTEPADAFIMFGGSVWPSEGSENVPYTQVTGDGTYTVSIENMSFSGLQVFCIDIKNVKDKLAEDVDLSPGDDGRCPNVTATINSIKLD